MEFIKFMFSSFWIFIGFLAIITSLLVIIFYGIFEIIRAIKIPKLKNDDAKDILNRLLDDDNNRNNKIDESINSKDN